MPRSLGTFIRERRQDLGLTQEDLAARVGGSVRQAEISRLESGRIALPRRERLEAIANALDISIGELLVRSGWMSAGDRLAAATCPVCGGPRGETLPKVVLYLASTHLYRCTAAVPVRNLHSCVLPHRSVPHAAFPRHLHP